VGGCVGGREHGLDLDQNGQPVTLLTCGSGKAPGQLSCHVHFRKKAEQIDAEAKVIQLLTAVSGISSESTIADCLHALNKMRDVNSETLVDFVVPMVNVVLHARNEKNRAILWDEFVVVAVKEDFALAHYFYWALMCVVTSPQAQAETKHLAEDKLQVVKQALLTKTQIAAVMAANDALKSGRTLPKVTSSNGAMSAVHATCTPLIELLQGLHEVGGDLVRIKDRTARQAYLEKQLEERVNKHLAGLIPVPVNMLAPGSRDVNSNMSQACAALLRLPPQDARVLSSKERAPFLVVLEVDRALNIDPSRQKAGWVCPCRVRREKDSKCSNVISGSQSGHHSNGILASAIQAKDQRPRGAFKNETWEEVRQRLRNSSSFGTLPGWSPLSLIIKSNADDDRQEELAYRLLQWFQRVFQKHQLKLWLRPFLILATSHSGGCLETVTNAISISELKKTYGDNWHSLRAYFESAFSDEPMGERLTLNEAIENFIWSNAAYSVVCYVLAIRDRHNGNILIDDQGHILHVDFGFMLCGSPGGKTMQKMGGFEHSAGFKLTREFVNVLGTTDDVHFQLFQTAVLDGIFALRDHADELLAWLQLSMLGSENSQMNCFCHSHGNPEAVLEDVCGRLGLAVGAGEIDKTESEFREVMERKVLDSVDHWRSRFYDKFQYHVQGVH